MFHFGWRIAATEATVAALRRTMPWKEPSIPGTAPYIVADVERAWRCYRAGAAAALFDVMNFHRDVLMPLPSEAEAELTELASIALSGAVFRAGQGRRAPLRRHHDALLKRLRHRAMEMILETSDAYKRSEDAWHGDIAQGADPEAFARWQRERPEASEAKNRAAALAWNDLGADGHSAAAIYEAFEEVESARHRADWPALFYVPSAEVCERLNWPVGLRLIREYTGSDAPRLAVA